MSAFPAVISDTAQKLSDNAHAARDAYKRTTLSREGAKVAFFRAAKRIANGTRTVAGVYKTGFSAEGAKVAFNGAAKQITSRGNLIFGGGYGVAYTGAYAAAGLAAGTVTGGSVVLAAAVYAATNVAAAGLIGAYKALKEEKREQEILAKYAPPQPWKAETTKTHKLGLKKLLQHVHQ